MAAAPGCIRNLGSKWNRVEGAGVPGRGWSLDPKARELRAGPGVAVVPEDDGIGDLDSPAAWFSPPFSRPPSGPRYSSDLRHMQMTRRVDNVQFLPFLTTDVK